MKHIGHYFPFFIVAIFLYSFFFYHHEQATVTPVLPVSSGEQAIELQYIEITEPTPSSQSEPENKHLEKKEPKIKKIQKSEVTKTENKIEKEISKKVEKKAPIKEITSDKRSEIQIAKQTIQDSSSKKNVISESMIKAELFAEEFNLSASTYDISAESIELTPLAPQVARRIQNGPQIIARPKVKKIPQIKKISKAKERTNKAVFKKQPVADTSKTQDQGTLQEAIVITGNTPTYPQTAILRNQQGRVVVKLTVTISGRAKDPEIITSSGYKTLDNAILDFVKKELFMPAHKGEEKITSDQVFSFRFELK